MTMKILVTGGAGFIGSNLVDRLLKDGHEVRVIDNFDHYYEPELKRKNIAQHKNNKKFQLIEGDINDRTVIAKAVKDVDAIIHEAAQPGVRVSVDNPLKTNHINTQGTLSVLDAAQKEGVKKIVFASSSSVYGKVHYTPFDENHPTHPISPYGVSKLACEHYCRVFSELYGMEIPMLRYFTVYGPRMRPDLAINIFMRRAMQGEEIVVFGNGSKSRDFTFVDDAVEGTMLALEKSKTDVYNIGGGNHVTVGEMLEKIIDITKSRSRIVNREDVKGDVEHTMATNKKAHEILGWEPKWKLDDGLKTYYEWLKSNTER